MAPENQKNKTRKITKKKFIEEKKWTKNKSSPRGGDSTRESTAEIWKKKQKQTYIHICIAIFEICIGTLNIIVKMGWGNRHDWSLESQEARLKKYAFGSQTPFLLCFFM